MRRRISVSACTSVHSNRGDYCLSNCLSLALFDPERFPDDRERSHPDRRLFVSPAVIPGDLYTVRRDHHGFPLALGTNPPKPGSWKRLEPPTPELRQVSSLICS